MGNATSEQVNDQYKYSRNISKVAIDKYGHEHRINEHDVYGYDTKEKYDAYKSRVDRIESEIATDREIDR
jgi:hypothetical protein